MMKLKLMEVITLVMCSHCEEPVCYFYVCMYIYIYFGECHVLRLGSL
jgi:hypothetical protein